MKSFNLLRILWPSFLVTAVQIGVLFTLIDPTEVLWLGDHPEFTRQGVYTLGFFLCWAMVSVACALTLYLTQAPKAAEWAWQPRR
jgi:hypothetical protein